MFGYARRIPIRLIGIILTITCIHLVLFGITTFVLASHGGSIWDIVSDKGGNEYVILAHSIIAENQFVLYSGIPDTFRTPGYPALLAALFLLISDSYLAIVTLHALLAGVTGAMIYLSAQRLGLNSGGSSAAALLYSLSLSTVFAVLTGQGADILYTTLYTTATFLLLTYSLRGGGAYVIPICIGITLGIATLTRPVGVLGSLPLIFGLALVPSAVTLPSIWSRVRAILLALMIFTLCLTPWVLRNYHATGHKIYSSLPTFNFVHYNIPLFQQFWNNIPENATRDAIYESIDNPPMDALRNASYADILSAIMIDFLRENAVPYTFFHSVKMLPFFVGSGLHNLHSALVIHTPQARLPIFPTNEFNITSAILENEWGQAFSILRQFWVVTLERFVWVGVFLLVFISPFFAQGVHRRVLLLFILIIFSNAFLSSPVTQPRYRIPAEPFIWLAAVYSITTLSRKFTHDIRLSHIAQEQQ